MRKLVLILLACLLACVAAADVAVETQSGVASLSADFAAEVQNAIDAQSDESVEEDEAADEEEDQADAESEDEAPVLLETVAEGETESDAEADSEMVESLESDLADLDAAAEELAHIDQLAAGVEEESDTELAAEADSESLEELENELNNFADQADQLEAAVDESAVSSFIESYDEVAADTMMDADPSMRLAQTGQEGFFDSLKKAASSAAKAVVGGAKAVGGAAKKVVNTVAKSGALKAISNAGKAAGKALVAAGKKVASGALKAVKKIAHKVANSGLGKLAKKALKGALKIGKKIAKKALKVAKKIAKIMIRQLRHKYKKYCPSGPLGKRCRVKRCKAHRLGCHHKCKNGGWSRRRHHSSFACKNRGGVHPDYKSFDLSDAQEAALDLEQGVVLPNGAPGPYANSHPPKDGTVPPITSGTGSVSGPITGASTGVNSLGGGSGTGTGSGVNPDGTKMWDGVKPRFPGQPDLPPVRRLPEDVEDCVACQYVWKQVEQDVGNSPITQTIYDSFHANALDAQRTPVFYPACQTMFDAVDDMIGDYMEGYTVDQVCENSMLCRPRDLNQFLRHQRATKGI